MGAVSTGNNHTFLSGGGEMGKLTREKDWSSTSLGDPESWPQSLRTTLSIVLNSKFPMFVYWGPDLICFYNDAYRPSLGENGKHPGILGQKAKEAWPEIWDTIKPLIDTVLAGGEATWSEDQLIPIFRNGKIEDVYWTFSYSPVNDESGKPAGVFVTCFESTQKVITLKKIEESEDQLNFAISAAELATWDLNPFTNRFVGNHRIKEWFGLLPEDEIELPVAIASIHPDDRQRVAEAIEATLAPGSDGNYDIEYRIVNPLQNIERIVLAKGKALFDSENKPVRFSGILQNITQNVYALRKAEESEKRFRNTVTQAPLGITIFRGPEFMVEMANETYLMLVDRKEKDFVGRPLFEALPEVKDAVKPLLENVFTTGEPFYGTEFPVTLNRYGKAEQTYFNFVYQALREEDGTISGIIVVAMDVTASVNAKHSLEESEKQFRNLVMQSPIPMTIFRGRDHIIEMANVTMYEDIWQKKESEIRGKKALEVFPELNDQKYPALLAKVFETGIAHRENESVAFVMGDNGMQKYYLDFEYAPLRDTDGQVSGIIITVNNVTEKVEARIKLEESEKRLNIIIDASELGTWELDLRTDIAVYSERYLEIFGYPANSNPDHDTLKTHLHPDDKLMRDKAFAEALATGVLQYDARVIWADGSIHWIEAKGSVFYDEQGKPIKLIGTVRDTTKERRRQQELLESEQKFRLLADSMPQYIWTGDKEGNLTYFNQSVFSYSGLTPEQVYTEGWLQIVHPDDREENIEKWTQSIATGSDFLLEHRFRRHDGVYRWQLSRAIPQFDEEGNIQMWVGTSTDIEDQKTFARELERQVQERTGELEQKNRELEKMNTELQSFAYVSSHDLQEPLRKIQTFASRIIAKESQALSDNAKDYFTRIQMAANRMQTLIEDLLAYSRTNTTERVFKQTDLGVIVNEVKNDFREVLEEKHAVIETGEMCVATIIPFQFNQLFHNLVGNSLKFAKPGVPPKITITSRMIKGSEAKTQSLNLKQQYCHITLTDNGIGFDPQYSERIFDVFQRLHGKDEYSGTGIGLAIVKKIVENHNGYITASGKLNEGARFDIYIPA